MTACYCGLPCCHYINAQNPRPLASYESYSRKGRATDVVFSDFPYSHVCGKTMADFGDLPKPEAEMASQTPEPSTCECEMCDDGNTATFFCVECEQKLCASCRKYHDRVAVTKSHQVTPVNESTASLPWMKGGRRDHCKAHNDQKLLFYCHRCEVAICLHCKLTSHEGHNTEDMAVAVERIRAEVQELSRGLQNKVDAENKIIGSISEEQRNLEQQRLNVLEEAKQAIQNVTAWLNEAQDELKKQLNEIADPIHEKLQTQLEQVLERKSSLTNMHDRVKQMLETGTHAELVDLRSEVREYNARVASTGSSTYKPPSEEAKTTEFFRRQSDNRQGTQAAISNLVGKVVPSGAARFRSCQAPKTTFGLTISEISQIRCFAFVGDGTILMSSDGSDLILFDMQGQKKESVSIDYGSVASVACLSPTIVLVSTYDGKLMAGRDIANLLPVETSLPAGCLLLSHNKPGGNVYCLGSLSSRVYEVHEIAADSSGKVSTAPVWQVMSDGVERPQAFDVSADAKYVAIFNVGSLQDAGSGSASNSTPVNIYDLQGQRFPSASAAYYCNGVRDICFSLCAGEEVLRVAEVTGCVAGASNRSVGVVDAIKRQGNICQQHPHYTPMKLLNPSCFAIDDKGMFGIACNYPAEIIIMTP